jgi:hypothetical protein
MKVTPDIVDAINRIPNKMDFCARYEIPTRTIYNLREPGYSANRPTILVVTMALQAEGLLKAPKKAPRS